MPPVYPVRGRRSSNGVYFTIMRENPHASLLYVGMAYGREGMQYISFQVNGTVEVLEKDSSHYRFLLASRKLFEFDKKFLYDLPPTVDPCGENGEFHSFVYDGPIFKKRIIYTQGDIVLRDNRFYYCDVL